MLEDAYRLYFPETFAKSYKMQKSPTIVNFFKKFFDVSVDPKSWISETIFEHEGNVFKEYKAEPSFKDSEVFVELRKRSKKIVFTEAIVDEIGTRILRKSEIDISGKQFCLDKVDFADFDKFSVAVVKIKR